MDGTTATPIAIVGVGAIMPQAPDAESFWRLITSGTSAIRETPKDRWDPDLYYDPDPGAPDKTYSKIGGWVTEFDWNPLGWKLPIPPRVAEQMDLGQQWSVAAARSALMDAGWGSGWEPDTDRVAVVFGNAMAGERHYQTAMRIQMPEFIRDLQETTAFAMLPAATREQIIEGFRTTVTSRLPHITEDTMPGELGNVLAGRVSNLFNFRGPNYITDAACASAMAGIKGAIAGLIEHDYDVAVAGGIDRNMGIAAYVKFCKIGALSASGSRPYDVGADGFVMGEGAATFVLKRLADAERDGDRIYAVLLGMAGSSDGKGKGITAPNPIGQRLAVERAWRDAGLAPSQAGLVEGHGTSTRVGDVVEVGALMEAFGDPDLAPGSIALGSVKGNIGHLKAAAGAAGIFKATMALHHKVLPPTINVSEPNPNVDWSTSPLRLSTELDEWAVPAGGVRRAGVSAFGFGGTNFHAVLEEYLPGRYPSNGSRTVAVGAPADQPQPRAVSAQPTTPQPGPAATTPLPTRKAPLRGLAVIGGATTADVAAQLDALAAEAEAGRSPSAAPPDPALADASVRLAVDFADAEDLAKKARRAQGALATPGAPVWRMLRQQGVFLGGGPAEKVAFLYTGQGSQYVNMLDSLRRREPIVADTFTEADRVMAPLLGKPLTDYIFIDAADPEAVTALEQQLLQTEITQPAVLATDAALTRLLDAYGITPDMVMGHSLGEYGALVAAGALTFNAALEAVSARGKEMADLTVEDNGAMAAVFAPLEEVRQIVDAADGYVVIANVNSTTQAVIGGATTAVETVVADLTARGHTAVRLPVSHAFHTRIVAPASEPLKVALRRLDLRPPQLPVVRNVDGRFYPTADGRDADEVVEEMLDILGQQVASPVQFVTGLHTLYDAGARVFVETGPKRALHGFVEDVLGGVHDDVLALYSNHPKAGDIASFNTALAGLYAAGHGLDAPAAPASAPAGGSAAPSIVRSSAASTPATAAAQPPTQATTPAVIGRPTVQQDTFNQLGHIFADALQRGQELLAGATPRAATPPPAGNGQPVVVSGAGLGLPGVDRPFDDGNVARILDGQQLIDQIPSRVRRDILDRHITRVVKSSSGDGTFQTISSPDEVIKLAGRAAAFDLAEEFGVDADRVPALDHSSQLAIAAGLDALRDAGIPLVLQYKTTSIGSQLPTRWMLPAEMWDDTGVVFASAFPGLDSMIEDMDRFHADQARRQQLEALQQLRTRAADGPLAMELDRQIRDLWAKIQSEPYDFDRRFLFKSIAFAHAQFAELIGARGPNTQINSACASTTQAFALAEDWIRTGRCRRVLVISGDDVTTDTLLPWVGAGFLSTGAAATDDVVEDAALPFDRRRHGMLLGMGAAAAVIESPDAARERGIRPICEILSTVTANSAFHGTRLNVDHVQSVMDRLLTQAEASAGTRREEIADQTVFVSHETYTPARGGSAAAEIHALRHAFGSRADDVVITNTKGFTGHAMGAGVEDVVAIKALETGIVPPVANFREPDPELGSLNLSKGGYYPVSHALRLAAGFGSQISMSLLRWVPTPDGARPHPTELGYQSRVADPAAFQSWLGRVSGQDAPELEVVQHRLRVVDKGTAPPVTPGPVPTTSTAPVAAAAPAPAAPVAPAPIPEPVAAPQPVAEAPAPAPAPVAPQPAAPPTDSVASDTRDSVASDTRDSVADQVVDTVAGLTGYPADLLDPDLDLEADLGIDTVKQAEVFAALRDHFDIPRDDTLKLRDFPTLTHVIGWMREHAPASAATTTPAAPASAPAAPGPAPTADSDQDPVADQVTATVAGLTGYPADLLDPDLDLEADLGIDTVKQAEVFAALRDHFDIPRDDTLKLRDFPTLTHVIGWMREHAPASAATTTPAAPASAAAPATAAGPSAEGFHVAPPAPAPSADPVADRVTATVAELTGYPADLLDPDLDLEADLGIDTVKQAEVFAALRDHFDIPRDDTLKLRDFPTLTHVIGWMRDHTTTPAAPASAPAAPGPAPTADSDQDPVADQVTATVAGLTGYPADLLDPDLDLEADLGIDTVKQAEVFAALRDHFDIPRDDSLKLRDFPTLTHVIGWMRDHTTSQVDAGGPSPVGRDAPPQVDTTPAPAALHVDAAVIGSIGATSALPRRVPVPVVRPPLDDCVATGVQLDETSRIVIAGDTGGVATALTKRLADRGATVLELDPSASYEAIDEQVEAWLSDGAVTGVYWLPALDDEGELTELDDDGWSSAVHRRVKALQHTMRLLYDQVAEAGTFLVTGTRLGGFHGYDPDGATAPLGGAVTGFTKAYAREREEALVKAVDFAPSRKTAALADWLIQETLSDPGAVELGRPDDGSRWAVGLAERPFGDSQHGMVLGEDTVVVVTGAAGSITSAITADLARASGGTFHLLDLTPEPDPDDEDLRRYATDRDSLMPIFTERLKAAGERPTPVKINQEMAKLERSHAALMAIQAVTDAGGTAHYHSVNLTDPDAVAQAMGKVAETSGRVDVLLHAAGLEISKGLPDKPDTEYDLVFDVKAKGWFHVLRAAGDMPIGATVAFSSVAGRFGNNGQTDYSAANDLLCKTTSGFRRSRPATRGIVLDWTAWGGIGMATRGSIPKIMEMAGIDMLPPEAGVAWIRRELTASEERGEVVVAGRLGILGAERHPSGGVDVDGIDTDAAGPMVGRVVSAGPMQGLVVETTLTADQPFLNDHRIDGTPVLPGVMGVESFAEVATLAAGDRHVTAIRDVAFAAPLKLYRDEPRTIRIVAVPQRRGEEVHVACRLEAERLLPGADTPQVTVHFTATVVLGTEPPTAETAEVPDAPAHEVGPEEIYRIYFHGPAYKVLGAAGGVGEDDGRACVGRLADDLPDNHVPADAPLTTEPRLVELCFQTAGVWEIGTTGVMALPTGIDVLHPIRAHDGQRVWAVARPRDGGGFDVTVVDADGQVYCRLEGYRTVQLPAPVTDDLRAPLAAAVE